jgi:hypothetical protein
VLEPDDIAPPATAAGLAAVIADKIPDEFDVSGSIGADMEPEPTLTGGGAPREKTFDELLNALPGFAGVAETKQVDTPQTDPEEEAELLADVRAEFDSTAAADELPLLSPEPDDMLELVDDVADDEDSDGWMSTLLEGRSDNRSQ